jgi:hypothetical protein
MATTTPNYGWDVPTSTDYVKDGATAIETLGDDIDTSLFSITSGKNVGLVHINTTSFTSVSTVNLNSIFTSAFDNYRIEMTITNTASTYGYVTWQSRNAGTTDTSSATFNVNGNINKLATVDFIYQAGQTSGRVALAGASGGVFGFTQVEIMSPALATFTGYSAMSTGVWTSGDTTAIFVAGTKNTAASHDGITFNFPATSNGIIRVYGYRNS